MTNSPLKYTFFFFPAILCFLITSTVYAYNNTRVNLTKDELKWLEEHPVLRIAPAPNFPPIEFFDKRGEYKGVTADFFAIFEKKLGITFEVTRLNNWNEVLEMTKKRHVDLWGEAGKTAERLEYMDFSTPYIKSPTVIIVRKREKDNITPEDLRTRRVLAIKGYASTEFIGKKFPGLEVTEVADIETGLKMVSFDLADIIIVSYAPATYYIEKLGLSNLKTAGEFDFTWELSFATRNDWPILQSIVQKTLDSISEEERQQIFRKWISLSPPRWKPSRELLALSALALVIIILAGISYWNKVLKQKVKEQTEEIEAQLRGKQAYEESLRRAKDEAEEATKLKDKFITLVSHDLKNPINRIMAYFDLIKTSGQCSKVMDEMVDEGQMACDEMTKLINEILNVSKIKGGKIIPDYSFFYAHVIAERAIYNYHMMASEKGIELVNNISKEERLYGDKKLLTEVFLNLISNAIKFCDKGDKISLYLPEAEKEASIIAVSDSGAGIDSKRIPHLFKYEEKTSTKGTKGETGTGFGLPLVHDIIEAHKGDIKIESTPGEGSTFYIRLPQVKPQIMIIDDEALSRRILNDSLQSLDVNILEADSGKAAIKLLEKENPHLILQDLIMPDMDGFELLKLLRNEEGRREIPVIVITADNKIETRERVFDLGADDFIVKPITLEDLIPRVRRFIG